MKLLLVAINAKYIHSNLAVYSLKAYANRYQRNIELVEYTINHLEEDILRGIYKEKADVVAFSCYIWNIDIIQRLVRDLRKVSPEVKIWFGGPEVSYDVVQVLTSNPEVTGIMIGEGEQTFLEVMEHYVEGTRELSEIDGIAFREDNKDNIIVTSDRQPLSLDDIPFPYKDLVEFKNKIIYYESSRGCPFSCSYCLSSIDKRVRLRSTELVKKELQFLMDHKVPQVKFVDRTFNCNKQHAMEIWQFIKKMDNGITNFHFEISADLLGDEEVELLTTLRPGQIQLEIGVQTTNPDTIAAIHRRMDLDKLKQNVKRIKDGRNIHQHLDLIAGLPLEDLASFERSFQEVYYLKPDQLQLGFLKVLKGALMEEESSKYGIIYRSTAPYEVLATKYMTYEEILKLKGICEMVEIYYNSGQFTNAVNYLERFYASPMKLYEAIHLYYERKALQLMAHNRIRRYEILVEFYNEIVIAKETGRSELELSKRKRLFEEILLMDLYLRENIKSRPAFAGIRQTNSSVREIYDRYHKEQKIVHIEHFCFDISASIKQNTPIETDTIVLFDYSNKDPISKSAECIRLELV